MDVVWGILLSLCYRKIFYEKENNCNAYGDLFIINAIFNIYFCIRYRYSSIWKSSLYSRWNEQTGWQNIIYQKRFPVQLTDTKARTVVEATVRFRVHYDNTNGLAFSTEVIAVVGGGTFTKTALVTIP